MSDTRAMVISGLSTVPGEYDEATGIPRSVALATTEIFDPGEGTWRPGPELATPRFHHTATVLGDGTGLVAGGWSARANLATTELLRPGSDRWSAGPAMSTPRDGHATVAIGDTVLLFGGQNARHHAEASVGALLAVPAPAGDAPLAAEFSFGPRAPCPRDRRARTLVPNPPTGEETT